MKLHQEIIKENLGRAASRLELVVVSSSQNGKLYTVSRRYGEHPIVRDFDGNVSTLLPKDLLPGIDIYGQNEIYELAQDETSRVQLLDRFLPQDEDYESSSVEVHRRLSENQRKLVQSLSDLDDVKARVDRLPKLEEQLRGFEELGIKEKLAKTSLLAREREIVNSTAQSVQSLQDALEDFYESQPDLTFINDEALKNLRDVTQLTEVRKTLERLSQGFTDHLKAMTDLLNEASDQLTVQKTNWQQAIQGHEVEMEKALRTLPSAAGKSGQEVGTAYQRLMGDIERIRPMKIGRASCREV